MDANVNNVVSIHPQATEPAPADNSARAAFQAECEQQFRNLHKSQHFTERYTNNCLKALHDLLSHVDKPLVEVTEADYEAWCAWLADERHIARTTQRSYQNHVRQFVNFIWDRTGLKTQAQATFGKCFQKFAHAGNSMLHSVDDEATPELRPLTFEEIQQLFDYLANAADRAQAYSPRQERLFCRDRALYYLMYIDGLRRDEVPAIKTNDWAPAPGLETCEKYALLHVYGKGARGSGPRHRMILTDEFRLAEAMAWYERDIRPLFKPAPGFEKHFFLSEQGKPLSAASIYSRFKEHLFNAGLRDARLSPHTLRRSMVTHEGMRAGIYAAKAKAGHVELATTQIYMHLPKDYLNRKAERAIAKQIQDAGVSAKEDTGAQQSKAG